MGSLFFLTIILSFTGLPSSPKSLTATTTQMATGKLELSWSPPGDTGGRSDLTYNVECERCEGSVCQPCGDKVRYDPSNIDIKETSVIVGELEPHLNYTFTVEARNGVSQLSSRRATSTIRTALQYIGQHCRSGGDDDDNTHASYII